MMTTAAREASQPANAASSSGAAKAVCRPQMQADISRAFALRIGAIQRTCPCGGSAIAEEEPPRRTVQTSLRLSGPGDPSELEARRVAEVMRSSEPRVQPLSTMRVASGRRRSAVFVIRAQPPMASCHR
jgi:hypothetical protein